MNRRGPPSSSTETSTNEFVFDNNRCFTDFLVRRRPPSETVRHLALHNVHHPDIAIMSTATTGWYQLRPLEWPVSQKRGRASEVWRRAGKDYNRQQWPVRLHSILNTGRHYSF